MALILLASDHPWRVQQGTRRLYQRQAEEHGSCGATLGGIPQRGEAQGGDYLFVTGGCRPSHISQSFY
jgi:hypothetical protein